MSISGVPALKMPTRTDFFVQVLDTMNLKIGNLGDYLQSTLGICVDSFDFCKHQIYNCCVCVVGGGSTPDKIQTGQVTTTPEEACAN